MGKIKKDYEDVMYNLKLLRYYFAISTIILLSGLYHKVVIESYSYMMIGFLVAMAICNELLIAMLKSKYKALSKKTAKAKVR